MFNMNICYATTRFTFFVFDSNLCDEIFSLNIKTINASTKYFESIFLTQRYRSQFQSLFLKIYNDFDLTFTFQIRVFDVTITLKSNVLIRTKKTSAFRYWVINKMLMTFIHCDDEHETKVHNVDQNHNNFVMISTQIIYSMISIQVICQMIILIYVM